MEESRDRKKQQLRRGSFFLESMLHALMRKGERVSYTSEGKIALKGRLLEKKAIRGPDLR